MPDLLEVFSLPLGPLQANCFVVIEGQKGLVIDPGDEADVVIEAFDEFGFAPAAVLVTHGHFDHVGGVAPLAAHFDIPVYIGAADAGELDGRDGGLSGLAGFRVPAVLDPVLMNGEQALDLPIPALAVPTPGHSPGAYTFVIGDTHLFVGDLLFSGSVGRTDLPGGDMDVLLNSVAELVRRFPPDSMVHSGHGPDTSLGRELAINPFLAPLRYDPEHRW
jgi:hydroxyacylglutathione hydrolase